MVYNNNNNNVPKQQQTNGDSAANWKYQEWNGGGGAWLPPTDPQGNVMEHVPTQPPPGMVTLPTGQALAAPPALGSFPPQQQQQYLPLPLNNNATNGPVSVMHDFFNPRSTADISPTMQTIYSEQLGSSVASRTRQQLAKQTVVRVDTVAIPDQQQQQPSPATLAVPKDAPTAQQTKKRKRGKRKKGKKKRKKPNGTANQGPGAPTKIVLMENESDGYKIAKTEQASDASNDDHVAASKALLEQARAKLQAAQEQRDKVMQSMSDETSSEEEEFHGGGVESLPPITALQKGVSLVIRNISASGPPELVRFTPKPAPYDMCFLTSSSESEHCDDDNDRDTESVWSCECCNSDNGQFEDASEGEEAGGDPITVSTPVLEASRKKSETINQNLELLKRKLQLKLKTKELAAKNQQVKESLEAELDAEEEGTAVDQADMEEPSVDETIPLAPNLAEDETNQREVVSDQDEPTEEQETTISTPARKLVLLKRKLELELQKKQLVEKRQRVEELPVDSTPPPSCGSASEEEQEKQEQNVEQLKKRQRELQILVLAQDLNRTMTQYKQLHSQAASRKQEIDQELFLLEKEIQDLEASQQESSGRVEELSREKESIQSDIVTTTSKLMVARQKKAP